VTMIVCLLILSIIVSKFYWGLGKLISLILKWDIGFLKKRKQPKSNLDLSQFSEDFLVF